MQDDLAPFESPKLLIEGAKARIHEFEAACNSFAQGCEYDVIDDFDSKTQEKVIKFRYRQRIPGRLRVDASGIVNDLRHSLDQAVCDGAIWLGRKNGKGVYFPFGLSAKNLDDEIISRCKKVDVELVTFIRTFNSHYGGDDLLYALGSLAGPNKHQRILSISLSHGANAIYAPGTYARGGPGPNGAVKLGTFKWSDMRNELEIARVGTGGELRFNVTFPLEIVIQQGEAPLSGPAPSVFRDFASKAESIVLGIEAETTRLFRERKP